MGNVRKTEFSTLTLVLERIILCDNDRNNILYQPFGFNLRSIKERMNKNNNLKNGS